MDGVRRIPTIKKFVMHLNKVVGSGGQENELQETEQDTEQGTEQSGSSGSQENESQEVEEDTEQSTERNAEQNAERLLTGAAMPPSLQDLLNLDPLVLPVSTLLGNPRRC